MQADSKPPDVSGDSIAGTVKALKDRGQIIGGNTDP